MAAPEVAATAAEALTTASTDNFLFFAAKKDAQT